MINIRYYYLMNCKNILKNHLMKCVVLLNNKL